MATVTAATSYVIGTSFQIGGVTGLGSATRQLAGFERRVDMLGARITGRLSAAFAAVATAHGFTKLVSGIASINAELEGATVGIATMFTAFHRIPMAEAMRAARSELKGLREDAAKGVGGLTDYAQGFQRIYAPGLRAGLNRSQIRELNRLAIGAAGAAQKPLREGPRDIVQALTSGVNERQTPEVVQALATIGMSAAQFRALGKKDQGSTLLKAYRSFQAGIDEYGKTWDAQLATMKDNVTDLARIVTRPLFERWKEQLVAANEWITKNRDALEDIAYRIGPKLVSVYDNIARSAGGLAAGTAGLAAAGVGGRLAGGMAGSFKVMRPPAGAVAAGGGRFRDAKTGKFVGMVQVAALTGPQGAAAAMLGAAIVGVVGASVASAIQTFPDLRKKLAIATAGVFDSFGELARAIGEVFNNPLVAGFGYYVGEFGANLMFFATVFNRFTTAMVESLSGLMDGIYYQGQAAKALWNGDSDLARAAWALGDDAFEASNTLFAERMRGLFDPVEVGKLPGAGEDGPPTSDFNYNFNGPIEIKVQAERMDDPNIVASTMDDVFRRLQEYPRRGRSAMRPKPI